MRWILLILILSAPGAASITDVEPVNVNQSELQGDIRVESPYHNETNVTELDQAPGESRLQFETNTSVSKEVWINLEEMRVNRTTNISNIVVQVDGELVNSSLESAQNKTWVVFDAEGESFEVALLDDSTIGEDKSLFRTFEVTFLQSPIALIFGSLFLLLIGTLIYQSVTRETKYL